MPGASSHGTNKDTSKTLETDKIRVHATSVAAGTQIPAIKTDHKSSDKTNNSDDSPKNFSQLSDSSESTLVPVVSASASLPISSHEKAHARCFPCGYQEHRIPFYLPPLRNSGTRGKELGRSWRGHNTSHIVRAADSAAPSRLFSGPGEYPDRDHGRKTGNASHPSHWHAVAKRTERARAPGTAESTNRRTPAPPQPLAPAFLRSMHRLSLLASLFHRLTPLLGAVARAPFM